MDHKVKRAILVNVIPQEKDRQEAMAEFEELKHLVETYGGIVILKIIQKRGRPSAKTFVGEGKAQEIADLVRELKVDIVVINGFLKANQSNHLINVIPCEVLDRFEMILKIFEKHAKSPESKLQVEIAMLKYEFPKLFGKGAILSQQSGGMAVRTSLAGGARRTSRGPGEKVLEVKRRHLRSQIQTLEKKLHQFQRVKEFQRKRRQREQFSTIALVGYTNSGKSTVMRAITKKENIVVENKLFSTLDTRLGEMYVDDPLKNNAKILIADTIGFMQNLPPLLFSSFLATLQEVKEADFLLHVIDVSDPKFFEKIEVVENILKELKCETKPRIYVFNKIDLCKNVDFRPLEKKFQQCSPVFISALQEKNLEILKNRLKDPPEFPI